MKINTLIETRTCETKQNEKGNREYLNIIWYIILNELYTVFENIYIQYCQESWPQTWPAKYSAGG